MSKICLGQSTYPSFDVVAPSIGFDSGLITPLDEIAAEAGGAVAPHTIDFSERYRGTMT